MKSSDHDGADIVKRNEQRSKGAGTTRRASLAPRRAESIRQSPGAGQPGNAADTYENIRAYASIPSVEELIVVHWARIEIEQLVKGSHNIWPGNPTLLKAGATLTLASIALTLPVADIFEGTSMAA